MTDIFSRMPCTQVIKALIRNGFMKVSIDYESCSLGRILVGNPRFRMKLGESLAWTAFVMCDGFLELEWDCASLKYQFPEVDWDVVWTSEQKAKIAEWLNLKKDMLGSFDYSTMVNYLGQEYIESILPVDSDGKPLPIILLNLYNYNQYSVDNSCFIKAIDQWLTYDNTKTHYNYEILLLSLEFFKLRNSISASSQDQIVNKAFDCIIRCTVNFIKANQHWPRKWPSYLDIMDALTQNLPIIFQHISDIELKIELLNTGNLLRQLIEIHMTSFLQLARQHPMITERDINHHSAPEHAIKSYLTLSELEKSLLTNYNSLAKREVPELMTHIGQDVTFSYLENVSLQSTNSNSTLFSKELNQQQLLRQLISRQLTQNSLLRAKMQEDCLSQQNTLEEAPVAVSSTSVTLGSEQPKSLLDNLFSMMRR